VSRHRAARREEARERAHSRTSELQRHPAISVARPADLTDLLSLVRAYYRFDGIRFRKDTATAIGRLVASRSLGRVWIMRHGPSAVGYAILTFNFDAEYGGLQAMLTDLYIRPRHRRQGLGRRTLDLISAYCRSKGIGTIELQVEEDNEKAQDFYRRLGFELLSRMVMSKEVPKVRSAPVRRRDRRLRDDAPAY
jgi:ribosomal protein S18 acetylase RimI-like enzyme